MSPLINFFLQISSYALLLVPSFTISVLSSPQEIPTLSPFDTQALSLKTSALSDDFKTYYYDQTLDHFNYAPESYTTFKQRYVINAKDWGGPESSSPILAYLCAEAPLDTELQALGFISDNAPYFKALAVYIEHRFYGSSIPYGRGFEETLQNKTLRGYFNSAQALADYAEVLLHVRQEFSAVRSPIIVVGGSYGGMLASWFRLKYPHIALGALASSAPILYFDDITPQNGYYSIVTKDFKEVSESCYGTIRQSWSEIERVASLPNGLYILSQQFKTCSQLKDSSEITSYLVSMYAHAAQYNHPPNYPVEMVCRGIDGAPGGTDVLGRIFAGVVSYKGNLTCYETDSPPTQTSLGWQWQRCSEMVMPLGRDENSTMFPAAPFNLTRFTAHCMAVYDGVPPRPHWVTTYYGGHDIKLNLDKFGSNIIFSNGLRDPYSSGGVLEDISATIQAVTTTNGSHCLDLHFRNVSTDPEWLVTQRKTEIKIIEGWIEKYYYDNYKSN